MSIWDEVDALDEKSKLKQAKQNKDDAKIMNDKSKNK